MGRRCEDGCETRASRAERPVGTSLIPVESEARVPDEEASGRESPFGQGELVVLMGVLGHELRGPLGAIGHALYLLRRRGADPATREYVEQLLDHQTTQMNHIIEDMVDLARSSTGKLQLQKRLVILDDLLRAAIEAVAPLILERRHRLEVTSTVGPITLEADPALLQQILTNLLTNAAKYTAQGGHIVLITECQGNDVQVRVRDNGIGIDPKVLPHVFTPFWRSTRARGHSPDGLGIGLAVVRHLVELHGGSVSAASDGPGQGSEFIVRIPFTHTE